MVPRMWRAANIGSFPILLLVFTELTATATPPAFDGVVSWVSVQPVTNKEATTSERTAISAVGFNCMLGRLPFFR